METIEEKQEYLRVNVLEKGYDPNAFMSFLTEKKGDDAADLNAWTFPELKATVEEFIASLQQPQPQVVEHPQVNSIQNQGDVPNAIAENKQKETETGQDNENKDNNEIDNRKEEQSFDNSIPCAKTEVTELSKCDKVTITLSFPEKVEGGLFSKGYVTY